MNVEKLKSMVKHVNKYPNLSFHLTQKVDEHYREVLSSIDVNRISVSTLIRVAILT